LSSVQLPNWDHFAIINQFATPEQTRLTEKNMANFGDHNLVPLEMLQRLADGASGGHQVRRKGRGVKRIEVIEVSSVMFMTFVDFLSS